MYVILERKLSGYLDINHACNMILVQFTFEVRFLSVSMSSYEE